MAKHIVDYSYDIPEYGSELIDIDPDLDMTDKEDIAYSELRDIYPDVKNISVDSIKELIES